MHKASNQQPAYQQAQYLTSAADFSQLPPDDGGEVAFIGRSNAGKSSALNIITGIKGLARTSKMPGRTTMINFFALNEPYRLVDLPGYGYAKAPRAMQARWEQAVSQYLEKRECLKGLIIIMDVRHPLKEMDQSMIEWAVRCGVPMHILLTKSDKLSATAAKKSLKEVQEALSHYGDAVSLQLFSSLNRVGLDEVKAVMNQWFCSHQ
jgi:GTP-binding protein